MLARARCSNVDVVDEKYAHIMHMYVFDACVPVVVVSHSFYESAVKHQCISKQTRGPRSPPLPFPRAALGALADSLPYSTLYSITLSECSKKPLACATRSPSGAPSRPVPGPLLPQSPPHRLMPSFSLVAATVAASDTAPHQTPLSSPDRSETVHDKFRHHV
jgi:hypothetical protein